MIAIIFAMRQELSPVASQMHISRKFNIEDALLYEAEMNGRPVVLVQGGIGRKSTIKATNHLLQSFDISLLISSGVAGGIKQGLHVGDLVIAENVGYSKQSDFEGSGLQLEADYSCKKDLVELARQLGADSDLRTHSGGLLTVDKVIGHAKTKKKIGELSPFLAVEMESAAVAEIAHVKGIEFAAIRSISDDIEDDLQIDYGDIITDDGKVKVSGLALKLMKSPQKLAILKRINKQTKTAARNLSVFMSRFIPLLHDTAKPQSA